MGSSDLFMKPFTQVIGALGCPKSPGTSSWSLRLTGGNTEWIRSATQRPLVPTSDRFLFFCCFLFVFVCLPLNVGFEGLLGSSWYFGGLEVYRDERYLEKVISECIFVYSVPLEPVSCSCLPAPVHTCMATVTQKALETPKATSKPLVLTKSLKQEQKSCNTPACKSLENAIKMAFTTN